MHKAKLIFKRAKIAYITLIFKRQDSLDKTNYRAKSILPTVSKISAEYYLINYNVFQINFFLLCSADSGKSNKGKNNMERTNDLINLLKKYI